MKLNDIQLSSVLIVEDDSSIREALELTFEMLGIQVSWAVSGEDALEKVHPGLSLMIVDGRLPDLHGLELVRRVRPQLPESTLYYLFSAEAGLNPDELRACGIQGLIRKPFDTERLIELAASHSRPMGDALVNGSDSLLASFVP